MKAQVAMEYLIIIGITLIVLVPLAIIVSDYINYSKERVAVQQLYDVTRQIADTAKTVYFFGYPSKILLKLYFPEGIQSAKVLNHGIAFILRITDVNHSLFQYSKINLTGNLTTSAGLHYVEVKALNNAVNISIAK